MPVNRGAASLRSWVALLFHSMICQAGCAATPSSNGGSPEAWTRLVRRLEAEGKIPRVAFMVDDLPENFVPRQDQLVELIGTLVDESHSEPVAITAALRGAGGYGKDHTCSSDLP